MTSDYEQQLRETRAYWDQEAVTFDTAPDHGLRDPLVRSAWAGLLSKALPSGPLQILDNGCGTGSLSLLLAEMGHTVTGIDLSAAMIAQAETKAKAAGYELTLAVADAFDPQLPPHHFEAIICRHLLWALPDPGLALERWTPLLKPGGRIVMVEGNWHTGGGLRAQDIIAVLPPGLALASFEDLSPQPQLWGGDVSDERYMLIAAPIAA